MIIYMGNPQNEMINVRDLYVLQHDMLISENVLCNHIAFNDRIYLVSLS